MRGTAATPTPVSRARCSTTPTARRCRPGASTSGSIDGGNTASVGNKGGSVSNDNATKVDVDASNEAESGDAKGANGGIAVPVNVNHEGDNKSIGGDASNSNGDQSSDGGASGRGGQRGHGSRWRRVVVVGQRRRGRRGRVDGHRRCRW